MNGCATLETDSVVLAAGFGHIFKWSEQEVIQELEYFMQTMLFLEPKLQLYVSTIWPSVNRFPYIAPALFKTNKAIERCFNKWQEVASGLHLIKTHELFCEEVSYLDEDTGFLRETYQLKHGVQNDFNTTGKQLGVGGWFKVRKLWLQTIGHVAEISNSDLEISEHNYSSSSSSTCVDSGNASGSSASMITDEIDELNAPVKYWRSPPSVL